jgi:hypothetical protein
MIEPSIASGNKTETQDVCIMVCLKFWVDYYILMYSHCQELMNSLGSHGSSLLFIHDEGDGLTLCGQLS